MVRGFGFMLLKVVWGSGLLWVAFRPAGPSGNEEMEMKMEATVRFVFCGG